MDSKWDKNKRRPCNLLFVWTLWLLSDDVHMQIKALCWINYRVWMVRYVQYVAGTAASGLNLSEDFIFELEQICVYHSSSCHHSKMTLRSEKQAASWENPFTSRPWVIITSCMWAAHLPPSVSSWYAFFQSRAETDCKGGRTHGCVSSHWDVRDRTTFDLR